MRVGMDLIKAYGFRYRLRITMPIDTKVIFREEVVGRILHALEGLNIKLVLVINYYH
jgi:hypothetical protein